MPDDIDPRNHALAMVRECRSVETEARLIEDYWLALIARMRDAAARHPDFAEAFNFAADALEDTRSDYMDGEINAAIRDKREDSLRDLPEGVRRDAAEGYL